jgi:hypothetical protein
VRSTAAFERGVDAYRRASYAEARVLWEEAWTGELPRSARAALAYDLGNASFRSGEALTAVGWFTVATRLAPRDADAWANLELARTEAGLGPADPGDLVSTLRRLASSLTPEESRWLALLGLLVALVPLALEAWFGGRAWKWASLLGALLLLLCLTPWIHGLAATARDPVLLLASPSASLRSEPQGSLAPITSAPGGSLAERIDALPGWARIELADGTRGWIEERSIFALER